MERAFEWLQKNWWGLLIAWGILCSLCYGGIWWCIEPLSLSDSFEKVPRWVFHILLALLFGSVLTLIIDLYVRYKYWSVKKITPEELKRVQKEIRPLVDEIGSLYEKDLNSTEIQNLVSKTVSAVSLIHFGTEEFPLLDENKSNWEFKSDQKFSCAKCRNNSVEITKSGQCKKCKLPLPNWYQ